MKPNHHSLVLGSTGAYTLSPLPLQACAHNSINDADIINRIKTEYAQDKLLQSLDIRVTAHKGVVSIIGKVYTDAQHKQAVMLALSAHGVEDVNTYNLIMKVAEGV